MSFWGILGQTLPVFIIIGIGALCRAAKLFNDGSERATLQIVLNVLYPCFIWSKVCGNASLKYPSMVATSLSIGLFTAAIALGVAYGMSRLFGLKPGKGRRTFVLAAAIQNYGFIPIPLIEGLFPAIADETIGVLFVYILGLELVLWTAGVIIVSGSRKNVLWRLVNAPAIWIVVALAANFTGFYLWVPHVVDQAVLQLGVCSIPISLLLVGATFAGVTRKGNWRSGWRISSAAIVVRFFIMPAFFFAAAAMVSFSLPLVLIMVVQASMPAALFPIVIAKHYNGKPAVAVEISVVTSIVSLLATPAIICAGGLLFDLN